MDSYYKVIGEGEIGDKAEQLITKTPSLVEIGFYVPHRTILADSIIKQYYESKRISEQLHNIFEGVVRRYSGHPYLIVRSSGEGDAMGTGVYKSEIASTNVESLERAFEEVVKSYFSQSAVKFREDVGLGDTFGAIIEPVIGQYFEDVYAPPFSGFGRTSTPQGEGYIVMVPGFGAGVNDGGGELITKEYIRHYGETLGEYILNQIKYLSTQNVGGGSKYSNLLVLDSEKPTYRMSWDDDPFFGKGIKGEARLTNEALNFVEGGILKHMGKLNLLNFFNLMKKMEDKFRKPQYFEWVLTFDSSGEPRIWITQIADIQQKEISYLDPLSVENPILYAHSVVGSGRKECNKLYALEPYPPTPIFDSLQKFNSENKNYILVYPSTLRMVLTTGGYKHIYNAAVLIEYFFNLGSISSPISHYGGWIEETNKFFGILDRSSLEALKLEERSFIYLGKFEVVSSGRHNLLVVGKKD